MAKSLPGSIVKVKRATAARWSSVNPVLAAGEFGYETDTRKLKLGDGTSSWTQLSYLQAEGSSGSSDGSATVPTFRIGTVSTLAYSAEATVAIRGTSDLVIFDFGLPRGKNVYEYAKDGGYTGTEAEFTALVQDLLSIADGNEVEY